MIKVYPSTEKSFNNNGLKILHPLSAILFKEDNGDYYIEIEDTIENIDYYQANMIITCPTPFPEGNQAFRIIRPEKSNTRIKIKAKHVYFDTSNYIIDDKNIVKKDCNYALNYLNSNCDRITPFTTSSDITDINTYRCVRKSLDEAINTLIDKWGGHLVRNNFNISIKQNIGADRGIVIKYAKNIKSIKVEENWDNVVTKILPVGKDGITLPEKYLEITDELYDIPFSKVVKIDQDLEQEEDESDDDYKSRLIQDLRLQAKAFLEKNKYPKLNYNLSVHLDKITDVGDTIYVNHPKLKLNIKTNVISVCWDVISKKYKNIEFGNFKNKLKDLLKNINNLADEISKSTSEDTRSYLEKELISATSKIWNTLGNSYVIYEGDKILIVDKLPKEDAKNVILINNGGIGFSNTGISGTFSTAWTIDGGFCADFITSGKINTSLIEGYDGLVLTVNKVKDLVNKVTENNYLELNDAFEGKVKFLSIKGNISSLFLSSKTYLSSTTFFKNSKLVIENQNGIKREIETNIKNLNYLDDIYDEFIIDETGTYIIRRIGINADLSLYVLEEEQKEMLDTIDLELFDGYNKIYMSSYENLIYTIKYIQKNTYTDIFASKVEMNAALDLQNENINLELVKKVDNNKIIAAINMSTEKSKDGSSMQILADKINMRGKKFNLTSDEIEFVSTNFNVDKQGNVSMNNATMNNVSMNDANMNNVTMNDVTMNNGKFKGNIYLPSGGYVLGGNGLLTLLKFDSNIRSNQFLGANIFSPLYYSGANNMNDSLEFDFDIPSDFTILKAFIKLEHIPTKNIVSDTSTITGYCRNLKLYKATNVTNGFLSVNWLYMTSNYNMSFEEVSSAFGTNGFTGSGSGYTYLQSTELKTHIKSGNNIFKIQTSDSYNQNEIYVRNGSVRATLYVYGYTNIN